MNREEAIIWMLQNPGKILINPMDDKFQYFNVEFWRKTVKDTEFQTYDINLACLIEAIIYKEPKEPENDPAAEMCYKTGIKYWKKDKSGDYITSYCVYSNGTMTTEYPTYTPKRRVNIAGNNEFWFVEVNEKGEEI
jgi:hypothetical protein